MSGCISDGGSRSRAGEVKIDPTVAVLFVVSRIERDRGRRRRVLRDMRAPRGRAGHVVRLSRVSSGVAGRRSRNVRA
jgi:hypothetical protein